MFNQKKVTAPLQEYTEANQVLTSIYKKTHEKILTTEDQQEHLGSSMQQERITILNGKKMHLETRRIYETGNLFMNKQDCITIFTKSTQKPFLFNEMLQNPFHNFYAKTARYLVERGSNSFQPLLKNFRRALWAYLIF